MREKLQAIQRDVYPVGFVGAENLDVQCSDKRFAYPTVSSGGFKHILRRRAPPRASTRRAFVPFCLWAVSALLPLTAQADPQVLLEQEISPTVYQGGVAVLTFTLTNLGPGTPTGLAWSDDLAPIGLQVVACPGAHGASCAGATSGTTTGLEPGSTLIGQQDYSLQGTCNFTVCVAASKIGTQVNTTSAVTSTSGTGGAAASASIDVLPDQPPTLSQHFSTDTVAQFDTAFLTLTIADPNFGAPLYGIAFTDTLPAGLKVGQNSGVNCSQGAGDITPTGTFTATPGSSSISVSGLQLSAPCSFIVEITGVELGLQTNASSAITSTNGGTGETSSASITVIDQVFGDGFE